MAFLLCLVGTFFLICFSNSWAETHSPSPSTPSSQITSSPQIRQRLTSQPIWRDGKSEWLEYQVHSPYRGFTLDGDGVVVTQAEPKDKTPEKFRLNTKQTLSDASVQLICQSEILWHAGEGRIMEAKSISGQIPGGLKASWIAVENGEYHWKDRFLDTTAKSNDVVLKAPLLLEESAFLEFRDMPLAQGFVKEMWWSAWSCGSQASRQAVYARIEVVGSMENLHDIQVWHVRVKPTEGRAADFWVQCTGTRPIIAAKLSNGSAWTLVGIKRR
jgi:hypothetical protein